MDHSFIPDALDQTILKKIDSLPENLKQEALDFIEFIAQKYSKRQKIGSVRQ